MRIALAFALWLVPAVGLAAEPESRAFATASGLRFFAGDTLRIAAQGADSIFAAGGTVEVRGAQAEHLFAAGGALRLADSTIEDAFLAGRDVEIAGAVADDLFAAGETITVAPSAVIGGDGIYGGRSIRIQGRSDGDVIAGGARVELAGVIAGNVTLASPEIVLAPGLRIGGALVYRSPSALTVPEGVTIAGGVTRESWDGAEEPGPAAAFGAAVAGALFALAAFAVFAAVFVAAAPGVADAGVRRIRRSPWAALGVGLAAVVLLPVVAVLAGVTLIGIPLGLFLFVAGAVAFGAAAVIAWSWLGAFILASGQGAADATFRRRFACAGVGLAAFVAAGFVPVLGVIAQGALILLGYGALALSLVSARSDHLAAPRAPAAV